MRSVLEGLYRVSGWLAALFMLAIAVVVRLLVGAHVIELGVGWLTGSPIGLVVPSYAEFAGFFLAATSFLALASTLRAGGHIRVELVLNRLPPVLRWWAELWCLACGSALAGYFAWHTLALVHESFVYRDTSPGIIPVPLWLPQSAMALGLVVLTVALLDALVGVLLSRRSRPPQDSGQAQLREG